MAALPQQQSSLANAQNRRPVSAEMEEIFVSATGLSSTHLAGQGAHSKIGRFTPAGGRRGLMSATTLGALAAVVLAGLSAGAVLMSRPANPGTGLIATSAPPAQAGSA